MTRGTLYGGLFLGSAAALVIAVAAAENAPAQNFERNPQTQILHLDVGDLNEAKRVRLAVLDAWSHSPTDDVVIEPMADAQGHKFYCIKLARQED